MPTINPGDPGYAESPGPWYSYGVGDRFSQGTATYATFSFAVSPGNYSVATYFPNFPGIAPLADYAIGDGAGLILSVPIDQAGGSAPEPGNPLGSVDVRSGDLTVTVRCDPSAPPAGGQYYLAGSVSVDLLAPPAPPMPSGNTIARPKGFIPRRGHRRSR